MEGRPVIQAVLPAEIQQREPVAEHQQMALPGLHRVPEGPVQVRQLPEIGREPVLILLGVGGVRLGQGVGDDPAQVHGDAGGGPDVLVVLNLLLMAVVVVAVMLVMGVFVVIVTALHALGELLPQDVGVVHHVHHGADALPGGVQDVVHPGLAFAAVADEHVRLGNADHVQGRGLKAVGLTARRYQQVWLHPVAADGPDEVVIGEQGAHHMQFAGVLLPPAGGAPGQGQRRRQQQAQGLHAISFHGSLPSYGLSKGPQIYIIQEKPPNRKLFLRRQGPRRCRGPCFTLGCFFLLPLRQAEVWA